MKKSPIKRKKYTGNTLVIAKSSAAHKSIMKSTKNAKLKLARSSDYSEKKGIVSKALRQADGLYFDKFKIAIINKGNEDKLSYLRNNNRSSMFSHTEPERYVYATNSNLNYIRGYKDSVNNLYNQLVGKTSIENKGALTSKVLEDSTEETWGIRATNVAQVNYEGNNIPIAILDTGFNSAHPDFTNRQVITESFHNGLSPEDVDGHGTHCIGIACGSSDNNGMRYGVASESIIYSGKVLNDLGEGTDANVIAGIEWAINNKCRIISMSLGAEVDEGQLFSNVFEDIARDALKANCLIIAASGNESNRPNIIKPVNHPANCPSIMSVGAIKQNLKIASFSNGNKGTWESEVDISGPGSNILSSYLSPNNYDSLSGTSMATPFVAGIAALYLEKFPTLSAEQLWRVIIKNSSNLEGDKFALGSGLSYIS